MLDKLLQLIERLPHTDSECFGLVGAGIDAAAAAR